VLRYVLQNAIYESFFCAHPQKSSPLPSMATSSIEALKLHPPAVYLIVAQ
jgi:hypothetical protein